MQVSVQPHTDYCCAQLKNHAEASLAAPAPASNRYADQFWHAACSASVASYRNTTLCASRSAPVDPTPANANCERRGFMCDRHGNLGLANPATSRFGPPIVPESERAGNDHDGGGGRDDGSARFGPRRLDRQGNPWQRLLQRRVFHHARASTRQGRRPDARIRQYALLRRSGHLPRHRAGRRQRAALHELHGSLRRRRAGQDRRRRRRPGRLHRRPAGPRYAGQAQGQDARNLPERHTRSAAIRLAEEERRLLQGRDRPLHGLDGRHGGRVQGRRDRHRLDDRALRLGAAQRREGFGPVVRRRRHLRPGIYRLRARREHAHCSRRTPRASRR